MALCLSTHDELYLINLDLVMYIQVEDHYAHVYYTTGTTFMIPFGLSKIEAAIAEQQEEKLSHIFRLGRKYIVNTHSLFHINTIKQTLFVTDMHGNNHSLKISKEALRKIMGRLKNNSNL